MANPASMPRQTKKKQIAKEWFRDVSAAEAFASDRKSAGFAVYVAEMRGQEWSVTVFEKQS